MSRVYKINKKSFYLPCIQYAHSALYATIGIPLFIKNLTKGSMSFQFSGSLSFIHVKHENSSTGFIHLSKTNTHVLYAHFMPAKNVSCSSFVPCLHYSATSSFSFMGIKFRVRHSLTMFSLYSSHFEILG